MRIYFVLFLLLFLNIFIFPANNTIEGELTKNNVKIGNGELASITVKYKLWTLMGEPVKITEYKYSASRSLVSGVKIYLKAENLTRTAWAYVQDCGGAIPKPGDNWSFNAPGSPKWSEFFGGTGAYEKNYFTEKQAKNFWKNGFTITDFIIEANLEEFLPPKSDGKYLKNTYDSYNEYFDKYKLSSSEIRRNEIKQEEEIYEKLQKEIDDFYEKQKRIQENRQFWADLMNIITTGINNIGKIIDENNRVLNKLNEEYRRDLKKIDEDIEREKRKAAEDEKRRLEEQKRVTENFNNYESSKSYDNINSDNSGNKSDDVKKKEYRAVLKTYIQGQYNQGSYENKYDYSEKKKTNFNYDEIEKYYLNNNKDFEVEKIRRVSNWRPEGKGSWVMPFDTFSLRPTKDVNLKVVVNLNNSSFTNCKYKSLSGDSFISSGPEYFSGKFYVEALDGTKNWSYTLSVEVFIKEK